MCVCVHICMCVCTLACVCVCVCDSGHVMHTIHIIVYMSGLCLHASACDNDTKHAYVLQYACVKYVYIYYVL